MKKISKKRNTAPRRKTKKSRAKPKRLVFRFFVRKNKFIKYDTSS